MCRNIKPLYNFEPPATQQELHDAALQYVRKISGSRKPSKANEAAFYAAVAAIAGISGGLLSALETNAPARDRAVEAAKRRRRAAGRSA